MSERSAASVQGLSSTVVLPPEIQSQMPGRTARHPQLTRRGDSHPLPVPIPPRVLLSCQYEPPLESEQASTHPLTTWLRQTELRSSSQPELRGVGCTTEPNANTASACWRSAPRLAPTCHSATKQGLFELRAIAAGTRRSIKHARFGVLLANSTNVEPRPDLQTSAIRGLPHCLSAIRRGTPEVPRTHQEFDKR